jgi:hypothetical protein
MQTTVLTTQEVVDLIYKMLIVRSGFLITEAVALERARNIASALIDVLVVDKLSGQ